MKVAILMGSPNDKGKMAPASAMLNRFGIDFEEVVMSAHRNPDKVHEFASSAKTNGFGVIICGAGMAAHLAGVVAANTSLPVIGVPLSGSALGGVDALYATVQMPKGIPVATVAIDGSANAAVLATQILALGEKDLADKLEAFRANGAR